MSQNPKIDYAAIIRENERIAKESDRKYRQMVAEHERQIAIIVMEAQLVTQRALLRAIMDFRAPKTRRITVAM